MKFSIVTPSFRSSQWLKLCIASVADQAGVDHEHIIQDACSDDGTQDWLPRESRVRAFIEKDAGLYDAVNRGWRRASGEILAQLNADEQYLPGALAAAAEAFERNPEADILLADTVVADIKGQFVYCRKSLVPWHLLRWTYMPTTTASIFFRRRVLDDLNLFFDARWRVLADSFWMREALQMRLRMAVLRRYTSVFVDTGENLSFKPQALREHQLARRLKPRWALALQRPLQQLHRLRALSSGLYSEKPFSYSIYTLASPNQRVEVPVTKPTGIWWQRRREAVG
jgi:glycosyltransferase involved in cell wall biosynthesis